MSEKRLKVLLQLDKKESAQIFNLAKHFTRKDIQISPYPHGSSFTGEYKLKVK